MRLCSHGCPICLAQGKLDEVRERLRGSLDFVLLLAIPITLGLSGLPQALYPGF